MFEGRLKLSKEHRADRPRLLFVHFTWTIKALLPLAFEPRTIGRHGHYRDDGFWSDCISSPSHRARSRKNSHSFWVPACSRRLYGLLRQPPP